MNNNCPVCNNTEHKKIGLPKTNDIAKSFINTAYFVVQCTKCQTYFVSPDIHFTDEQWAKLYNNNYFGEQNTWLNKQRQKELNRRFNKLEKAIDKKQISFLDVGTGEGKTIIEAKKRNWNVTAIDIVDNRLNKAKFEDVKFIRGDFLETDLPKNNFDFIYFDSVLEHVQNPLEYLKKSAKLLTDGGLIYIGVPNEDCLFNDVRKLIFKLTKQKNISTKIKPFDSPYHIIGFNNNSLKTIIANAGLEILILTNIGRKFEFMGNKLFGKDFWINFLFLFPVEYLGYLTKRDLYFEVFVGKKKL